jgi:site-specific DNA recombinase
MDKETQFALLYCRVSSKSQDVEGDGLGSQEHRCREYAEARGYVIEELFTDIKTAKGDFFDRKGMKALVQYLRNNRGQKYIVIFDDLKRFARDTEFHIRLRKELAKYGARPECLNFRFEDTPEGKFVETVIAAGGQLEREQNGRQTMQKMMARVAQGYAVTKAPPGYRYQKVEGRGKMLVRDEPLASIVEEALTGYANGRFQQQREVVRFLETQPAFPHDRNGEVHPSRVRELLTRPIYAGCVEAPQWNISRRKGLHEPIISYETYQQIQDRLNGIARAPQRKDLHADFPLRGAVICGHCSAPLTAAWSKGRSALHPYYHCKKRGCEGYKKSIRREVIEGEFLELLRRSEAPPHVFEVAQVMFRKLWDHMALTSKSRAKAIADEIARLDRETQQCLDKILAVTTPAVVTALEKRIGQYEEQKLVLTERKAAAESPARSFDETVRTALRFLSNPCILWDCGTLEARRMTLRLAFVGPLVYTRNEGFRTAELSSPLKHLSALGREVIRNGARGRSRTDTLLRAADFESAWGYPNCLVRLLF